MARTTPERVLRDLGRRVAEIRVAKGFTQDDFAGRIDVSLRYVQAIEAGEQNCTIRTLTELANGLGVRPLELLQEPKSREPRRRGRPPRITRR